MSRLARTALAALTVALGAWLSGAGHAAGTHVHAQSTVLVSMQNQQFLPANITVAAGTTVVWENDDDPSDPDHNSHDVAADDGSFYNDTLILPGQQFAVTLTTPGTYSYYCDLHVDMIGVVTVQ